MRYSKHDGLAGNTVTSILSDPSGNLWLGTDKGLSKAIMDSGAAKILRFRNYDRSDGIIDDDFSFFYGQNAHQNSKGEMFLAGAKGITIFHPDDIGSRSEAPPLVATGFYLNFKSASYGEPGSPLTGAISRLKHIDLSHEDNSFAIELAALDFHAPKKNRYAYKLEGFQDDWIYPGNEYRAVFTQVPPGTYTFRAKAANSDGVWNEKGLTMTIRIFPPWYRSWWAYMIYGILIISLVFSLRHYELNRQQLKLKAGIEREKALRLKELDQLKTRFFTNISHEFRTPLTLIKGPVEKEMEQTNSKSSHKRMKMVMRNVNRLMYLIKQLLDLSALEAKQMKLRASETDLVAFAQGITMGFASWAERKNISLKIYSTVKQLNVCFDRDMMEKILNNLLSNAIKFTNDGGKVEVTIEKCDHTTSAQITLKDNGMGIPEEKLRNIFDRFYQVDASNTREHEGTGIGLALVKELVELHGGKIYVESRIGHGSTFTITFPLGMDHLQPEQIMASVTESRRVHSSSVEEFDYIHDIGPETNEEGTHSDAKKKPLILIVEDHSDFRLFIRDILAEDYRILEAKNGQKGWEKAFDHIPDLIISDVMMPRMTGYELCEKLKNDERTCHIPIILLTAKAALADKMVGLNTGADDYLSKPFDSTELLSRVQNLITQRRNLQTYYQQRILLKTHGMTVTSADETFLQKALEIVELNLENEHFSVEELAKEVNMSRSQLHRKISALTGKSASHFIRSIRLQYAGELLQADAGNITEIAYKVGFSSQSYFTKCFIEQFECSPTEFKKRTQ